MSELAFSSLAELARGLEAGRYSAVELARHYLARIARANEALHAYVSVDEAGALRLAQAADARRAAGYALGPLDGLPIAIKDLCEIEGQVTTAGSAAWRERRSKVTGTAVRRLLAAGMVVLGKTHMVEFAFGGWGTNPVMGTPRNPWDCPTRVSRAARPAVRAWPWPPAWRRRRWARTPAGRCGSRPRSTASPA